MQWTKESICTDMMKQGLQLSRKPHIVIATPGRLADHIQNTDTVSFKRIKFLVKGKEIDRENNRISYYLGDG